MRFRFFLATAALLSSAQLHAASQHCHGTINNLLIGNDGILQVVPSWRGDWIALCSTVAEWKGVATDACRSWQAVAITALTSRVQTVMHFADAPACAQMPHYGDAPPVGYVSLYVQ